MNEVAIAALIGIVLAYALMAVAAYLMRNGRL